MGTKSTTQTLAGEIREGQAKTVAEGEIITIPEGDGNEPEEDEIEYIHVLKVKK